MGVRYGAEWQAAQSIGANAASILAGLSRHKDRALLLHLALNDPCTLSDRRYLLALRVSLKLRDGATWAALVTALMAQPKETAVALRAMLSQAIEALYDALLQPWLEQHDALESSRPPDRPTQLRPAARPGAPAHH